MSLEEVENYRRRARYERVRAETARPVHRPAILDLADSLDRVADAYERLLQSRGGAIG